MKTRFMGVCQFVSLSVCRNWAGELLAANTLHHDNFFNHEWTRINTNDLIFNDLPEAFPANTP